MTDQEVYEASRAWIAREGATRCVDELNACVYLSFSGNKCAIGGIMPIELLTKTTASIDDATVGEFAGTVDELCDNCPAVDEFFSGNSMELLMELQNAHDDPTYRGDSDWQFRVLKAMDNVAETHGLKVV